jgi:mRNA-degrading endonuclease RelE of RelBE toxin-antitoxin system
MDAYRRLRASDPQAAGAVAGLVRRLAGEPYQAGAIQLGGSNFYRLHVDDLRIMYECDEATGTVFVHTVGRVPGTGSSRG